MTQGQGAIDSVMMCVQGQRLDRGCPFCRGRWWSQRHAVRRCKGCAVGSYNIRKKAVESWERVRRDRFRGIMGETGLDGIREQTVDAVEEVLAEFFQAYPMGDSWVVGLGDESVEAPFVRGQSERWVLLDRLGWIVREMPIGDADRGARCDRQREADVGGAEDGWVYGLIPERIIKIMKCQVRRKMEGEDKDRKVRAEVEPYLRDIHGVLVVGGYALCCVYEAEVIFWSKSVDRSFGWEFFSRGGEEGGAEERQQSMVQQTLDGGREEGDRMCRGVLCEHSDDPGRLERGGTECRRCRYERALRGGVATVWNEMQGRTWRIFGSVMGGALATDILSLVTFKGVLPRGTLSGALSGCRNISEVASRAGVPLQFRGRSEHWSLEAACEGCRCGAVSIEEGGFRLQSEVWVSWRAFYGSQDHGSSEVSVALGETGVAVAYHGTIVGEGTADGDYEVRLSEELPSSVQACDRVGSDHPLVGSWVMISHFEREESTLGRVLCVSNESELGYVMDWMSGKIVNAGVESLSPCVLIEGEEEWIRRLPSESERTVMVNQDHLLSTTAVRGTPLQPGEMLKRCGECGGVRVGWGDSIIQACALCGKIGGPGRTCLHCGQFWHIREMVFAAEGEQRGKHVVHNRVQWVVKARSGEGEEIVYCRGVHPGRWMQGICPRCCCRLVREQADMDRGRRSEEMQERFNRVHRLLARNLETTLRPLRDGRGVLEEGAGRDIPIAGEGDQQRGETDIIPDGGQQGGEETGQGCRSGGLGRGIGVAEGSIDDEGKDEGWEEEPSRTGKGWVVIYCVTVLIRIERDDVHVVSWVDILEMGRA